ncbi:unnamed protein product [Ambrosiozyma monospora]|uniref:Unnamed protein product n=1 Tax=Ambrosiozyma monospora TaxID=43982 RepID=A0ACB5T9N6_AMBMO|nr:unnamed protein product [Ambrosiozyma monospora]
MTRDSVSHGHCHNIVRRKTFGVPKFNNYNSNKPEAESQNQLAIKNKPLEILDDPVDVHTSRNNITKTNTNRNVNPNISGPASVDPSKVIDTNKSGSMAKVDSYKEDKNVSEENGFETDVHPLTNTNTGSNNNYEVVTNNSDCNTNLSKIDFPSTPLVQAEGNIQNNNNEAFKPQESVETEQNLEQIDEDLFEEEIKETVLFLLQATTIRGTSFDKNSPRLSERI